MIHRRRQSGTEISRRHLKLDGARDVTRTGVSRALGESPGEILGDEFLGFEPDTLGGERETVVGSGCGDSCPGRCLPGNTELDLCAVRQLSLEASSRSRYRNHAGEINPRLLHVHAAAFLVALMDHRKLVQRVNCTFQRWIRE